MDPLLEGDKLQPGELETLCCASTHECVTDFSSMSEKDKGTHLYSLTGCNEGYKSDEYMRKWLGFFVIVHKQAPWSKADRYMKLKKMSMKQWELSIKQNRRADIMSLFTLCALVSKHVMVHLRNGNIWTTFENATYDHNTLLAMCDFHFAYIGNELFAEVKPRKDTQRGSKQLRNLNITTSSSTATLSASENNDTGTTSYSISTPATVPGDNLSSVNTMMEVSTTGIHTTSTTVHDVNPYSTNTAEVSPIATSTATQPLPKSPLVIVPIPGSDPGRPPMNEAMDTLPDISISSAMEATNMPAEMQAGNYSTSVVEILLLLVSPTDQEIVNINTQQISTGNVLPTNPISLLQFTMDVPEAAVHVVVGSIKTDDTGTMNQFTSDNFGSNISSDGATTKRESNVMPTSSGSASVSLPHIQSGHQQLTGTTLKDSTVRLSDIDIDL